MNGTASPSHSVRGAKIVKRRSSPSRRTILVICAMLIAAIWAVFGRTLGYGFVNYDDDTYVYHNLEVARGLSADGLVWAFTHSHSANWHPVTWISHMIDCQIWGLNPAGHHFMNVLLHTIGTLLLFFVLRSMTQTTWRSALVAGLFGVHPLHVESVAWVAERKDVLSGILFFLTLACYVNYVRKGPSLGRYAFVVVVFALGLMCKPTLVTTPFVLLLLDYWPLGRFNPAIAANAVTTSEIEQPSVFRLFLEKIPLFALSIAASVVTVWAQKGSTSVVSTLPFGSRVANALTSYVVYLWQTVWPLDLAVLYPHPENTLLPIQVVLAACFLGAVTAAAIILSKIRPYFIVGWLWYLGMLVPMIGLVQVGVQAHADRYTYLPHIGLTIAIVWGLCDVFSSWRRSVRLLGRIGAGAIIIGLMWCSTRQAAYWSDTESLWNHTIRITSASAVARINLANSYVEAGRFDEAVQQCQQAVDISRSRLGRNAGLTITQQTYADAENNLGLALSANGQTGEARIQFESVLSRLPNDPKAHLNLGTLFLKQGRVVEAIEHFTASLNAYPQNASALFNLGNARLRTGNIDEAIANYERALKIEPGFPDAENNLAIALLQKGLADRAMAHWNKAFQMQPDRLDALNNVAWVLATWPAEQVRDGKKALDLSQRAIRIGGENPMILRTLAAAYAEIGDFTEASSVAQRALGLPAAAQNPGLADGLSSDLVLYNRKQPVRTPPRSTP